MSWFTSVQGVFKRKLCIYLLHRYFGQFLEEKLTLDQLEVNLYNGTATVSDMKLDVQALNELGKQQNFPVEFVDGYIAQVSLSIPWASLFCDSSFIEVEGLTLTIQPQTRVVAGASMLESMWSSMTSSMQLGEEFLKEGMAQNKEFETEPVGGLEVIAQFIDTFLKKVKVKFLNTKIRLEHVPKESNFGVAVEARVRCINYFDEAGVETDAQQPLVTETYQVAAFTTKKFCFDGVSFYTDEFPSRARTFSRSVISMTTSSTPESKNSDGNFGTAPVSPNSSPSLNPEELLDPVNIKTSFSNLSLEPDPILCAKISGRQEVRVKLKQTEVVAGPKIDLELVLGSMTVFLSPRQLHVFIELVRGLASPDLEDTSNVAPKPHCIEKPMAPSDFKLVEEELQQQLNPFSTFHTKSLQHTQGWSTASLDDSDDEFLPMRNAGMNESALSGATSMDTSMSSSITSSTSTYKSDASEKLHLPRFSVNDTDAVRLSPQKEKPKRTKYKRLAENDNSAEVSHFHIRLNSIAVVLLHEDILTVCVESESNILARSSVQQMKSVAQDFFDELGIFGLTGYGNKDFEMAKEVFLKACQLNHLRLLAAPIIIDGHEKEATKASAISGSLTAASFELLECLIDKKTPLQTTCVEYVELLRFVRTDDQQNNGCMLGAQPEFKLQFKHSERTIGHGGSKLFVHPQTDILILLKNCCSEIDISIVDRITAVLYPQPLCRSERNIYSTNLQNQGNKAGFHMAGGSGSVSDSTLSLHLKCPLLKLKFRFPIPDLRPIHDMDRPPWWKRSVRKDFITFEMVDAHFQTVFDSNQPNSKYELLCREVTLLFNESDASCSIPFAFAATDDQKWNPLSDGNHKSGSPRLTVVINPSDKFRDFEEPLGEAENRMNCSSIFIDQPRAREPSPFSSKRTYHESDTPHDKQHNQTQEGKQEELIMPGTKEEMSEFIEFASCNSHIQIQIHLPTCSVLFPSKHLYEVIYNRVSTDIFLWEPSAPKPCHGGVDLSTAILQDSEYPAFTMCKSGIQYDSDSDSEDGEGVFFSTYDNHQKYKKMQDAKSKELSGLSHLSLSLVIGQGILSLHVPVRDSTGNIIPGHHGELELHVENGNMFIVSGYKGKTGLGFMCFQVNQAALYHKGLVPTVPNPSLKAVGSPPSSYLDRTIYKCERGTNINQSDSVMKREMFTAAIKISLDETVHNVKTFCVSLGLHRATLRHFMTGSNRNWIIQLKDFFDVMDDPVTGYEPPGVMTEFYLNLWDCFVDYRPLHLPVKCVVGVKNLCCSSNIVAQTNALTLRFIVENAALFISDKVHKQILDLLNDYVCVVNLGLLELSIRYWSKFTSHSTNIPQLDLRCFNDAIHIRTCADSAKSLMDLITYVASDGDFICNVDQECKSNFCTTDKILVSTADNIGNNIKGSSQLSKSQVEHIHELMKEAMQDTNGSNLNLKTRVGNAQMGKRGVEVFFFPDENHPLPVQTLHDPEMCVTVDNADVEEGTGSGGDDDSWESEFCILDKEAGLGFLPPNSVPEVRILTNDPIRIIDNHFTVPLGKIDLLKPPAHFPNPVNCYTLKEMNLTWHMYGGNDFGNSPMNKKHVSIEDARNHTGSKSCPSSPPFSHTFSRSSYDAYSNETVTFSKSNPSEVKFGACSQVINQPLRLHNSSVPWPIGGGPGRLHNVLMELQLSKLRVRFELYPDKTKEASRLVILVNELEVRDKLASSQINKFLYQYSSEARPKQTLANMIVMRATMVRPDVNLNVQECCLRVSVQPLRFNIDQDSLLFLIHFFDDVYGGGKLQDEEAQSTPKHNTPTHQPPIMTVNIGSKTSVSSIEHQPLLIMLEDDPDNAFKQSTSDESSDVFLDNPSPPIFFRNFLFSPDVPIKLDYHGKRVDMTHGPLAGLLMGLAQLNNSELRLKRLSNKHGLLSFEKLLNYALSEWTQDIKKNQLPNLLVGVGPMPAVVQLVQGIRDLIWLPYEQYQKDGRIVRGLQRGANSFTTSTLMAVLELTNRFFQVVQSTAEMAYDMVSPGPSVRRNSPGKKGARRRRRAQPADIREGFANAYSLVREGLGETAQNIVRVASEEHEQKGVSGAVGGVLRQIPPTVMRPFILASEATTNVIGGMQNQLVPDARREAAEKWKPEI